MAARIDNTVTNTGKQTGKLEDFLTEIRTRNGLVSGDKGKEKDSDKSTKLAEEAARRDEANKQVKAQKDKVDALINEIKDSSYKEKSKDMSLTSEKEQQLFKEALVNKLNEPKDYATMVSIGPVGSDFMYVARQNAAENPFLLSQLKSAVSTTEKMDFDKYTIESGAGNLINKFASEGIKMDAVIKSVKVKDSGENVGVLSVLYISPVDALNDEQITKVINIMNTAGLGSDAVMLKRPTEMNELEMSVASAPADNTPDAVLSSIVGVKNSAMTAPALIVDDIKNRGKIIDDVIDMVNKKYTMKMADGELVFYDGTTEMGRFPIYDEDMKRQLSDALAGKDKRDTGGKSEMRESGDGKREMAMGAAKDEKETDNMKKGKKGKKREEEDPVESAGVNTIRGENSAGVMNKGYDKGKKFGKKQKKSMNNKQAKNAKDAPTNDDESE